MVVFYMRYPRTQQERKANLDRKWNRAKRNPCNLPTSYDDIWVRRERSWKENKKKAKQYGVKAVNKPGENGADNFKIQ
jgi:hypothetical protein